MAGKIRIRTQGALVVPLDQFEGLQGGLKHLSKAARAQLRALITGKGFIDAVAVWRNGGKYYLLNGHQRIEVVRELVAEGWEVPGIPVQVVEADSLAEAKSHLLALSSNFATVERDGLHNFLQGTGLTGEALVEQFRIPDFSMREFVDEFLVDVTPPQVLEHNPAPIAGPAPTPPAPASSPAHGHAKLGQMSNTGSYKNPTQKLETYLASDVRRITLFMKPDAYESAVNQLDRIAKQVQLKDYTEVLFYLLGKYADGTKKA